MTETPDKEAKLAEAKAKLRESLEKLQQLKTQFGNTLYDMWTNILTQEANAGEKIKRTNNAQKADDRRGTQGAQQTPSRSAPAVGGRQAQALKSTHWAVKHPAQKRTRSDSSSERAAERTECKGGGSGTDDTTKDGDK